ncbi:MAG: hypothetical protein ACRER1_05105 [Gammaproteobacteria bacterium]
MKDDNSPLATILCIIGIFLIGFVADALILMIAPPPISVRHLPWWGLIGLCVVRHFGAGAVSHYLSAFHLASWPHIAAWAHYYPGYWGWIVVARWWWLVAAIISLVTTFRFVWRTPKRPDQHRRGTQLSTDMSAYRQLIHDLKNEED